MSDQLWAGTRKGLFRIERRNNAWHIADPVFPGDPVSVLLHDARDKTLYCALKLGHFGVKMRRSQDNGKTWQEHASPEYPKSPANNSADAVALDQVWALECGGADRPGTLWAGTNPGGLFVTHDRGDSWALIDSLWNRPERKQWFGGGYDKPGVHSVCVDPRDSRHVTIAVSCGGVWRTRDGGETWSLAAQGMRAAFMPPEQAFEQNIQDPHHMVQCPAQPDTLWVQHHNGIFKSIDGAHSWQEIAAAGPSTFGFAVAVHPHDANTAWFVPAIKDEFRIPVDGKLVVTRTRDGGRSFDVLSNGLPQRHAYDLIYRHGLDIDRTGTRLAFGSTTGGLWISENAGDAWSCVSTHLPPIYCVRFGA